MTWVQIVLLILQVLKQLKGSETAESFAESVTTAGQLPAANGDLLKWLWENREQVIEFVKIIVGLFPQQGPVTTLNTCAAAAVAELRAFVSTSE